MTGPARTRIVIIGAGFGGIGLGIKLRQAGLTDFVILEKSGRAGGVWRENSYPGAACDVPSHLYSFSFAQHAGWPDKYARRPDILGYLDGCVREHGLEAHIRFHTEVTGAQWDEARSLWVVRTREGDVFEAQSLVTATGQLSRPYMPAIPGIENFAGPVFHSAQWRHDCDLTGKRVAVIGTGASAIQFVPEIAPHVARLTLFQRNAAYVLPKSDTRYSRWQRSLFKKIPGALRLSRAWTYLTHEVRAFAFVTWRAALRIKRAAFLRHLQEGVSDETKRRHLIPHYRIGCKRILISNDYYPALDRANVAIVTEAIKEARPCALVTADGKEHAVDCIIFGTGFTATDFLVPMTITGRDRDLHQVWRSGANAYLGTTVAGFPNFFMLYGPNTNLGHNSIIVMIESQIRYVIACLQRLARDEIRSLDVKPEVQRRWNASVQQRMKKTIWATGCTSWYLTPDGTNTNNWPGYTFEFAWRTRAPTWSDYDIR